MVIVGSLPDEPPIRASPTQGDLRQASSNSGACFTSSIDSAQQQVRLRSKKVASLASIAIGTPSARPEDGPEVHSAFTSDAPTTASSSDHPASETTDLAEDNPSPDPPTAVVQKPVQPRFSKLTLPPKYDHLPLETRLWLQSRIADDEKDASQVINAAPRRRLSWANIFIFLDLCLILLPVGWAWLMSNMTVVARLAFYLLGNLLSGLSSAARVWAGAQLLALVDESMHGAVSWDRAVRAGFFSVLLELVPLMHKALFSHNERILSDMISKQSTRSCLEMCLARSITESHSPLHRSMLDEACAFAGLNSRAYQLDSWHSMVRGGSKELLRSLGQVTDTLTDFGGQVILIYRALDKGGKLSSRSNALVMGFALAPLIVDRVHRVIRATLKRNAFRQILGNGEVARRTQTVENLATSMHYKPETMLFGMKDWILKEYDEGRAKVTEEDHPYSPHHVEESASDMAHLALQQAITAFSHILIATRTGPTSMSLSSMNMLQRSVGRAFRSFTRLHTIVKNLMNFTFNVAAFHSSLEHMHLATRSRLHYDDYRYPDKGMHIELRNLTFTYPGATNASLRNVNLTIESGETLAVVGYNGGGKSTLVKIVLGLYDGHEGLEGDVLINGHPIGDYHLPTFYARTSCVFQDFAKYPFNLSENVGVGDTSHINDGEAIAEAIARGGADAVKAKHGLDKQLSPYSVNTSSTPRYGPFGISGKPNGDANGKVKMGAKGKKNGVTKGANGNGDAARKGEDEDEDENEDKKNTGVQRSKPFTSILLQFLRDLVLGAPNIRKEFRRHLRSQATASLSGGQWQRVAIARAFMRAESADLVAFDEPSSALDPQAEADLFTTIHSLSTTAQSNGRRATTVYVSHRFSTVRSADKIAFVDNGEIIEYGSHTELMALRGKYHKLFSLQRSGFDD